MRIDMRRELLSSICPSNWKTLQGASSEAWNNNTDLFYATTIARMIGHCNPSRATSGGVAPLDRGGAPAGAGRMECHGNPYPHDQSISQLFEDQVERTPDAVALLCAVSVECCVAIIAKILCATRRGNHGNLLCH